MRIFDRLVGLETEYAIRYRPHDTAARPTNYELYSLLIGALAEKLPTASASEVGQGKPGVFLANGGAVWFERNRFRQGVGLIEGCTPECRGPRQLVGCQRAQDQLLADTARAATDAGEFSLLKNCRDSQGNSYGAQENYEVVVARGWRMVAWRVGWVVVYPVSLLVFPTLVVLFLVILLANLLVGLVLYSLIRVLTRPTADGERQWRICLFGLQWVTHDTFHPAWPDWLEEALILAFQVLLAPVYLLLCGLMALTDLRRTQRRLLPFVVSRAVIGGSGWLDERGRFHVTEKAETRRFIWNELIPGASKPVFNFSHFVKMIFAMPPRWRELMGARQRLQISLGDSNLCEEAEYLRVATTLLVIDAIEAGAIRKAPVLWRPMQALRRISQDPTLTTTVRAWGRGRMTAVQIQRWYLEACRRFLAGREDAPEEAREVLRRWEDVLDRLENDRASLVGRLDWVTKEYLLERAGAGLPAEARKKLDLRYHELSPQGYFARLRDAGQTARVVSEAEVEQAMRFPPPSSPAVERARYIREFSGTDTILKVGWRLIEVVRNGVTETKIDLRDSRQ